MVRDLDVLTRLTVLSVALSSTTAFGRGQHATLPFLGAAALPTGLLRYPTAEPTFLAPGGHAGRDRHRSADLNDALAVLHEARDVVRISGAKKLDGLIEEAANYLEMKGTEALLFQRLLDEGN